MIGQLRCRKTYTLRVKAMTSFSIVERYSSYVSALRGERKVLKASTLSTIDRQSIAGDQERHSLMYVCEPTRGDHPGCPGVLHKLTALAGMREYVVSSARVHSRFFRLLRRYSLRWSHPRIMYKRIEEKHDRKVSAYSQVIMSLFHDVRILTVAAGKSWDNLRQS